MRIVLILLIPIFISSCGSGSSESETEGISPEPVPVVNIDPHQVGTLAREIVHDKIIRRFILYVPDSYDRNSPTPLLFNFHGYGSNAEQQMNYGDFRSIADNEGFLILHPQGTRLPSTGSTHFNVGGWTRGSNIDDVGFTNYLINVISRLYNIDELKIFSTGMSNGGFMSYELACKLSARIAGIASVTGSMTPETYDECVPDRPVTIIQMHGIEDTVVPLIGFGTIMEPLEKVMKFWVDHNDCEGETVSVIPDAAPNDNSTGVIRSWEACEGGAQIEYYLFAGAGHTWPGNQYNTEDTNYDINASETIWGILKDKNLQKNN